MTDLIGYPPIELAPRLWPALELMAATLYLEADGQPDDGMLAVGWVIRNRVDRHYDGHVSLARDPEAATLVEVLLTPQQFSCWNADVVAHARARLTAPPRWERAWKFATLAWWKLLPDPTRGATLYLNPVLTRAMRPRHDLPEWYDAMKVVAIIADHEFLVA